MLNNYRKGKVHRKTATTVSEHLRTMFSSWQKRRKVSGNTNMPCSLYTNMSMATDANRFFCWTNTHIKIQLTSVIWSTRNTAVYTNFINYSKKCDNCSKVTKQARLKSKKDFAQSLLIGYINIWQFSVKFNYWLCCLTDEIQKRSVYP